MAPKLSKEDATARKKAAQVGKAAGPFLKFTLDQFNGDLDRYTFANLLQDSRRHKVKESIMESRQAKQIQILANAAGPSNSSSVPPPTSASSAAGPSTTRRIPVKVYVSSNNAKEKTLCKISVEIYLSSGKVVVAQGAMTGAGQWILEDAVVTSMERDAKAATSQFEVVMSSGYEEKRAQFAPGMEYYCDLIVWTVRELQFARGQVLTQKDIRSKMAEIMAEKRQTVQVPARKRKIFYVKDNTTDNGTRPRFNCATQVGQKTLRLAQVDTEEEASEQVMLAMALLGQALSSKLTLTFEEIHANVWKLMMTLEKEKLEGDAPTGFSDLSASLLGHCSHNPHLQEPTHACCMGHFVKCSEVVPAEYKCRSCKIKTVLQNHGVEESMFDKNPWAVKALRDSLIKEQPQRYKDVEFSKVHDMMVEKGVKDVFTGQTLLR